MDNPVMGAEDFSYVLEKVPGAMFWLGASEAGSDWRQCCGLHSNHMVLDETVMARGAALHAALAERFLNDGFRSEEHTSELQSLMRISYAVFCLKKKNKQIIQ